MHDSFLLKNISVELSRLCNENNIARLQRVIIGVNPHSHINENNLLEYLNENHSDIVGRQLELIVKKEDIEEGIAIIHSITGDSIA